jgi:hypothetical protein
MLRLFHLVLGLRVENAILGHVVRREMDLRMVANEQAPMGTREEIGLLDATVAVAWRLRMLLLVVVAARLPKIRFYQGVFLTLLDVQMH